MREHDFVQTAEGIYRVFGSNHPRDGLLLLLRYWRVGDEWVKPPKYAPESPTQELVDHYDVPVRRVERYNAPLGIGPADLRMYVRRFDPLASELPAVVEIRARTGCEYLGPTGSRLVDLAGTGSDLDLVIYESDAGEIARLILGEPSEPHSLSLRRFMSLASGSVPRMRERNLFTGVVDIDGRSTKVDLHFCASLDEAQLGALNDWPVSQENVLLRLDVRDSTQRLFFPGVLYCSNGTEAVNVEIKDHAMKYLLPGDVVVLRGNKLAAENESRVVGVELLEIEAR